MSSLQQPLGLVSSPANPSNTQVQFTPTSSGWSTFLSISPAVSGAELTLTREAEVVLRTALIGIFASLVTMGCFPGTELPCLKNALAVNRVCLCLGSDPALDALQGRQGEPSCTDWHRDLLPVYPVRARGGLSLLPNDCFTAGEIGTVWKMWRVDYFPAAYNNVTVTFSATVLRTQPGVGDTMARLPFL